jgi:hypothetical protein
MWKLILFEAAMAGVSQTQELSISMSAKVQQRKLSFACSGSDGVLQVGKI